MNALRSDGVCGLSRTIQAATALCLLAATPALAYRVPKLNTLYDFVPADYPHIGNFELSPLLQASDGDLYGVSAYGGVNDLGYVYKVSRDSGLLTHLHDFGFSDGATPRGRLLQARDGYLYGTTESGGVNQSDYCYLGKSYNQSGCGTLFKISLDGRFAKLHDFYSVDDGYQTSPGTGVVEASDGNLYGMAVRAYPTGTTSLFKADLAGKVGILHLFAVNESEGFLAYAGLLIAGDGSFYGTTSSNGAIPGDVSGGCGTVFRATIDGVFKTLHTFTGASAGGVGDGCVPWSALIQSRDGRFYGTTTYGGNQLNDCFVEGCGTVFSLTPEGTETVLYRFTATADDGEFPQGDGIVEASDGTLYGTTGGNPYGEDGAPLCYVDRRTTSGCGTIYSIAAAGTLTQIENFGASNGAYGLFPHASLILGGDGNLYGNTFAGGGSGFGSVYRLVLNPKTPIAAIDDFSPAGGPPSTAVVLSGTGFTGTTQVTLGSTSSGAAAPIPFAVVSDHEIMAVVPEGAQSSAFGAVTPRGTTYSPEDFYLQPAITGLAPTSGRVGSGVTLQGAHFDDLASITFGGVTASQYGYVTDLDDAIEVTVPPRAKSGRIVVTNPGGSAASPYFRVVEPSGAKVRSTAASFHDSGDTGAVELRGSALPILCAQTPVRGLQAPPVSSAGCGRE